MDQIGQIADEFAQQWTIASTSTSKSRPSTNANFSTQHPSRNPKALLKFRHPDHDPHGGNATAASSIMSRSLSGGSQNGLGTGYKNTMFHDSAGTPANGERASSIFEKEIQNNKQGTESYSVPQQEQEQEHEQHQQQREVVLDEDGKARVSAKWDPGSNGVRRKKSHVKNVKYKRIEYIPVVDDSKPFILDL